VWSCHVEHARARVSYRRNQHAMMDEMRVEGERSGLLTAILRACTEEHATNLAHQRSLGPVLACGVPERLHLSRSSAVACGNTNQDGIGFIQFA